MKKFIDYCFYRAATFYKEWHDFFYPIPSDDYLIAGAIISYGNLAYNLLSLWQKRIDSTNYKKGIKMRSTRL